NTIVKVYPVVLWDSATNTWDIQDWVPEGAVDVTEAPADIDYAALEARVATDVPSAVQPVYDSTSTPINEATVTIPGLDIGLYLITAIGDTTDYEVMGVQTYTYENENLIGPLEAKVYA